MSSVNFKDPTEEDFLGILSLIFWTLTLIPLIKYVFIVLRADDHGEGGTFALYSFLCRHLKFKSKLTIQDTKLPSDTSMRYYTQGSAIKSKTKNFIEGSPSFQNLLTFVVLLGTCMVIGDGALTPATSGKFSVVKCICCMLFLRFPLLVAIIFTYLLVFFWVQFSQPSLGFNLFPRR